MIVFGYKKGGVNLAKIVFNGNRCVKCGGYFDEGGICHCGIDQDSGINLRTGENHNEKTEE